MLLKGLKFCRIKKGEKAPFEKEWQKKPYSYEEIMKFFPEENYGVLCGYENLLIIDADTPELTASVLEKLPATFRVQTGSGGIHHYFFCPELKKKIVLTKDKHYGEIQSWGSQCVAPNSIHPNGKKYEIIQESEIATITLEQIKEFIKPFTKEETNFQVSEVEIKDYEQFINEVCEKWVEGNRQELALSTAGYLRKEKRLGANKVREIVKEICKRTNDDEVEMRLRAVIETFKKDEVQIKGIKGLKEKGLQEKIFKYFSKETNFLKIVENFHNLQPFYYDGNKNWWLWISEDFRWERIDETDLLNSIDKITEFPHTDQSIKGRLIEAFRRIGRKKKPLEPEKTWIQFKDKIVDIKTGEKFDAEPTYFIFNPIPHEIGKSEETPIIDKLLNEWVGKEYSKTLKEIMAYCFLADMPIHRIFCLIGEGLNGKGTFLRLIENFVGEYNKTSTEIEFITKNNFESSKLYRKLICTVGEIDKGIFKRTKTMKTLSGDDLIRAEFKGKDGFDFHNYAKILISTNHLPETTDRSKGFYRRWTIVDFPNEFSEKKNILDEIPKIEYNNFCLQAIRILRELIKEGNFENDGTINDREKRYEIHSNTLMKFIKEYYEICEENEGSVEFGEFYENYCNYLKAEEQKIKSKIEVGKQISLAGFGKKIKKVYENGFETTKMHIFGLKRGKFC